jgi:hypothetical protein
LVFHGPTGRVLLASFDNVEHAAAAVAAIIAAA